MRRIPETLIVDLPLGVSLDRDVLQIAYAAIMRALRVLAEEYYAETGSSPQWPQIKIEGRDVMPPGATTVDADWALRYLNGSPGRSPWLPYLRRTLVAYNRAVGDGDMAPNKAEALRIAALSGDLARDAATFLNGIAIEADRIAGKSVSRPLTY